MFCICGNLYNEQHSWDQKSFHERVCVCVKGPEGGANSDITFPLGQDGNSAGSLIKKSVHVHTTQRHRHNNTQKHKYTLLCHIYTLTSGLFQKPDQPADFRSV